MAHPEDIHNLQILMSVMLSQIDQKVQTATKWVAVHESLSLGVVQILKSITTAQIKTYFQQRKQDKEAFLSKLARTLERSLAKSLPAISDKDVNAIYSLVSALFKLDTRIEEFLSGLETTDRNYFFNLHNNSVFAFSLVKLVSTVAEISNSYFEKTFKSYSSGFLELDLYNPEASKALNDGLGEDFAKPTFFKDYVELLSEKKFFESKSSQSHFMVPFQMLVVDQLKPSHKGALLWVTKVVLNTLLTQICKKKKFINFMGFLSIVLNINALYLELQDAFPDYTFKLKPPALRMEWECGFKCQLNTLGELMFLKSAFLHLVTSESAKASSKGKKKDSQIVAASKRVRYSTEVLKGTENINFTVEIRLRTVNLCQFNTHQYTAFSAARVGEFEVPAGFNIETFFDNVQINTLG